MTAADVLLAVPNISEGRRPDLVHQIAGDDATLLDVHIDPDHNRTVLTLGGEPPAVIASSKAIFDRAVHLLDLSDHDGAHPRFGVVDVFPFVPYGAAEADASRAADELAAHAVALSVPAYYYDAKLLLPDLRRRLRERRYRGHPSAGVMCVGVRAPLIAFNVTIHATLAQARRVAADVRRLPHVRALAFDLPSRGLVQVSMNLVEPQTTGPRVVFDRIEAQAEVQDAEVVGLVPASIDLGGLPLRGTLRTIEGALDRPE